MIKVLVDSSSDYGMDEVREKNLEFVPIHVTIDQKDYADGIDFAKDEFYALLKESRDFPKTSQPSPEAFLSYFRDAQEKGDTIICILLSSSLSGTCQSAMIAKDIVEYENIYIIDSLAATFIIKLLADYAVSLIKEGYPAEEIVAKTEALKSRTKLFAGLDTLEYLAKGGRLSKSAAAVGELANIKPIITLTPEGSVGVLGKCIGKNKAIAQVLKHLQEENISTEFPLYVIYTYGTENCEKFEEKLLENGYSISGRLQVGATIGAHIGPNAFGVVFVAS
ncbi:MAG: DegV family protein [Lachnospiraceae bacterium]|nr:DegV family protein [Lachnospiraceae bacterium]